MGRKPLGRVKITITIDPDILEWLNKTADERRSSVSRLIQESVLQSMKLDQSIEQHKE